MRKRVTYSWGTAPKRVIRNRLPELYNMQLVSSDVRAVLYAISLASPREYVERFMEEQLGGGTVERFMEDPEMLGSRVDIDLNPDDMLVLLDALAKAGDERGLRSGVLETLDIEEI